MHDKDKSGNSANFAKSATRITKAILFSGLKGGALVAIKETAPLAIKILAWVLFFIFIFPLIAISSLPNIFFGFDSAESKNIKEMTGQAQLLGSTYMNLDEFQRAQMDIIVTRLVSEYEAEGIEIDEIEITSEFDEEDLYWLIAINSVNNQQDLSVMTTVQIQDLSIASLAYESSIFGDETVTLKVNFDALDPQILMNNLDFNDEKKNWSENLQNTLFKSDALSEYGDYFDISPPDYGGDTSYDGDILYGGNGDNTIDISGFINPETKNNLDLATYAKEAYENGWGYVWGTFGSVLTDALFDYKLAQYPSGVGNYSSFIRENWLGRRTTDCVGLIKGYGWLNPENLAIEYGTNGMPDFSADQMYNGASVRGTMATMPDTPGLAVWKKDHIGVYIGDGMVVEAMGTKYGVVMTELDSRGWQGWCEIEYIDYH